MSVRPLDWRNECIKRLSVPPVWRTIWSTQQPALPTKIGPRLQGMFTRRIRQVNCDSYAGHENQISINTVIHEKGTQRTCWNILISWTSTGINFSRMCKKFVSYPWFWQSRMHAHTSAVPSGHPMYGQRLLHRQSTEVLITSQKKMFGLDSGGGGPLSPGETCREKMQKMWKIYASVAFHWWPLVRCSAYDETTETYM
jgi:hypothetical protein